MMTTKTTCVRVMLACLMVMPCGARRSSASGVDEAAVPTLEVCTARSPRLPATIALAESLRVAVQAMLQRSATFRYQCRRLADAPQLYVRVRVDVLIAFCTCRARSEIQRSGAGALVAVVGISPSGSPIEWIAHEFEHLLEQLDGLRLADLAAKTNGVWRTSGEMFETERAIRAGHAVLDDMRSPLRRGHNFVE
jgi:hypothetical protein